MTSPLTDLCPPPQALAGEAVHGHDFVAMAATGDWCIDRRNSCRSTAGRAKRREQSRTATDAVRRSGAAGRADDLSPQELATELSGEPTADELHRTIRRFRRGQASRYSIESLLGNSSAMQKVRAQVAAAAASGANVLIYGRRGTGRGTWPGPFTTRRRERSAPSWCRSIASY